MGNFLKINETDVMNRFVISGIISDGENTTDFILQKTKKYSWKLLIKISDGKYFLFRNFSTMKDRGDIVGYYPAKAMTWIYKNIDIIMSNMIKRKKLTERIGEISFFDRIEIEIISEYLKKTGSYVKGIIFSSSKKYYFDITLVSYVEPWTLFISNNSNSGTEVLCNCIPNFKFEDYENRKIINWLGQNLDKLTKIADNNI